MNVSLQPPVTQHFYQLTPERILGAVEGSLGIRLTGRTFAHNSMENRVYELWIDHEGSANEAFKNAKKTPSVIAKFYRPSRWSRTQIEEEHQLLFALAEEEIPVAAPLRLVDGCSLHELEGTGIMYALFTKMRGQLRHELNEELLAVLGRLIARMHNVAAVQPFSHRITLDVATYGRNNLDYLLAHGRLPMSIEPAFAEVGSQLCTLIAAQLSGAEIRPIHGDLHPGNILWHDDLPCLVDFDDALNGPAIQDLWLLLAGRDDLAKKSLDSLLQAYTMMRSFDAAGLALIEGLRTLRYLHFSAWIARRWEDASFKRHFPHFGTDTYWQNLLTDLREQAAFIADERFWRL